MDSIFQKYSFGIIYKATNSINGKPYIGQTIRTLHKRKLQHINDAKRFKYDYKFDRALRKYKEDVWKWEIVYILNEFDNINELEIKYVKENDSYYNGYNSTFGGQRSTKFCLTNEEKQKHQYKIDKSNLKYFYKIFKDKKLITTAETLKYFCKENNINYESFRVQVGHCGFQGDYIVERILLSKWKLMTKEEQESWIKTIPDIVLNKINEHVANHDKYNYKIFKDKILIAETTNLKKYCISQQINYRLEEKENIKIIQ
jgi:hypothetical protein